MKQALIVFIGGGFGSMLRYVISKKLNHFFEHFYLGTFLVNVLGCLLIGFLLAFSEKNNFISQNQMLLLATGFCGGFTTFSTFAYEQHNLLRTSGLLFFSSYTLASIVLGIIAIVAGIWLAKLV